MPSKPRLRVFLDSNVIFSGLHSAKGPAGMILDGFLQGKLTVVISQQVLEEVVRTLKEKLPEALPAFRRLLVSVPPEIVRDPTTEEIDKWAQLIHPDDASILAAAIAAQPDFLVTGDKHFRKRPGIAAKSGLRIVTPAQFQGQLRG